MFPSSSFTPLDHANLDSLELVQQLYGCKFSGHAQTTFYSRKFTSRKTTSYFQENCWTTLEAVKSVWFGERIGSFLQPSCLSNNLHILLQSVCVYLIYLWINSTHSHMSSYVWIGIIIHVYNLQVWGPCVFTVMPYKFTILQVPIHIPSFLWAHINVLFIC